MRCPDDVIEAIPFLEVAVRMKIIQFPTALIDSRDRVSICRENLFEGLISVQSCCYYSFQSQECKGFVSLSERNDEC